MPPKKAVPGAKAPAKSTISQSKPTPTRPAANQGARKPVSKPSPTKGKNPTAQKSSSRKSPTKAGEKKNAGDKKPLSKDVPLSLTKEDKAAIKLQSHFRKLIAKKFVEKKKLEKEEYEEMIEKLQREVDRNSA